MFVNGKAALLSSERERNIMGKLFKLHKMLINKEISSSELTQKHLCAIHNKNSKLNAYVRAYSRQALLDAEKADRKIASGKALDVLVGIPMSLKDNLSAKGTVCGCCSKILEGYRSAYDATAWSRVKGLGGVLLGKTNMDEFAMGCTTETSTFGLTKNPHRETFVAGGSSGGSAAAVAADLGVYSLASDTGGSVRQPAAFCGCVGFKPSYGAVSRYGLISYASSLDTVGIIAQSAEDVSLVFDRISGFDPMDSTTQPDFSPCSFKRLQDEVKGLKIAVPRELADRADGEVREAVLRAAEKFEKMGAEVELISMPLPVTALPAYYIIACAEASSNLGRYDGIRYGNSVENYDSIEQMICKTRGRLFGDEVKKRILLGTFVLSEGYYQRYYLKAQQLRQKLCVELNKVFEKFDALLTPTSPKTAFKIGEAQQDRVTSFNSDLCTAWVNLAGLPAVSLPFGKDSKGLPIGIQLVGDKFKDSLVLRLAHHFQENERDEYIKATEVEL